MPTTDEKPVCLPGSPDNKGTPFDPARHIPRINPKSGRWIPRSPGRGHKGQTRLPGVDSAAPAPATPAAPAPAAPAPSAGEALPPAREVTADALIDLPDAKPAAPAPGAAPAAAPTAPAPLPEIGPGETLPPAGSAPAPGEPVRVTIEPPGLTPPRPTGGGADVTMNHEAAGELAARTTYALTGALIGDHKKATACGREHDSLKMAFASFFQYRGVMFVGSVALGLVLLAYVLGEARKEEILTTFKKFFAGKKAEPGPAPIVTPPPASPAAQPAAAPKAATPPRPFILGE